VLAVGVGRSGPVVVCHRDGRQAVEPTADEPDSLSTVWRAGMDSTHHNRLDGVAVRFQRREDNVSASQAEPRRVLKAEPKWADLADKAHGLDEEPAALAFDAAAPGVRGTEILAGWRADDDLRQEAEPAAEPFGREGADVVMQQHRTPLRRPAPRAPAPA
jgi:hypothetical protein